MRWTAAIVLTATLLSACTSSDGGDEANRPQILPTPEQLVVGPTPTRQPEGRVLDRFLLEPGMCFNTYEIYSEQLDEVTIFTTIVDCRRPHDGEVYSNLLPYPGGEDGEAPFPGNSAIQEWGNLECYGLFEAFVGTPYELSALEIGLIRPTTDDWEGEGRPNSEPTRSALCYVFAPGTQLSGPMQGSEF